MIRGRSAEHACELAAVHYRRAGRADVVKQATGMRQIKGRWMHAKRASVDFRGTLAGGKSIAFEVKQHAGVSFPLNDSTLPYHQRDALDAAAKMYAECWLIVDLPDVGETFAIEWAQVQAFIARPYRHSLSLQWMRAHGYLCKASGRGTKDFRIWFLDYTPHEGRATAYLAEAAERARNPIVDLEAPVEKQQTRVQLTKEERLAGVRDAIEHGKYRKKAKGWI